MAIALDATVSGGFINPGTSLTASLTVGSGTNRGLYVAVCGADTDLITGATYNGVTMTLITSLHDGVGARYVYLFWLAAPASGAHNIVVSSIGSYIEINAASYTGMAQTGPEAFSTATNASSATLTATVTTLTDNAWTILSALNTSGSLTAGSGATIRGTSLVGAIFDSNGAVTPPAAKSMTFTGANGSAPTSAVIVSHAPAAAATITIGSPSAAYKTVQRSGSGSSTSGGGAATVTISGTYSGSVTPTLIEYRWKGGSWATLDAAPASGAYTGSVSLAAGQGSVEVRFGNDTSINATLANFGVGENFLFGGDSRWEGRASNAQNYSHATLKAARFNEADTWGEANDPIDTGTSNGSHWPRVASQIMANQSVPVAFISTATGSTDLAGSNNQWAKNNSAYANMIAQVSDSGVNAVRAALFGFGPNAIVNATTISKATYNTALDTFVANVVADVPGAPIVFVDICGETGTGSPPNRRAAEDNQRGAVIEAAGDNSNLCISACLIDQDYSDDVHPSTDTQINEIGDRIALSLLQKFFGGADSRGPRLVAVKWNAARTAITVVFNRVLKTGLTHATGAWIVSDNGSTMTVSSVTYHGTNNKALIVTVSAAATGGAGTSTISFASGDDAKGLVVPRSADITMPLGNTINLPAEPIHAAAVSEVATVTIKLKPLGSTASLTGLKWAAWDEVTPNLFTAPTDQGAAETTNSSSDLVLQLPNSVKTAGEIVWITVTNSDGTLTQSPPHRAFSGPCLVS